MICLWRYLDNTKNYHGYHLSADARGCRLLQDKLASIRSKVSIPLDQPDKAVLSVPNNQGGKARWIAGAVLFLETRPELSDEHFDFEEQGERVVLTCSTHLIGKILRGVEDMGKGEGDYAISGAGNCSLWFWWQ
jgi:hypothetical protein